MILANYTTSLLFGPRTALVQGAVIQWAEHTVGIWILCLAVAVHALGLVLTSWTAQLPLYLGLVAVAVLALVLRQVGKGFARRHAVRELLTLVRTSLQNVNLQQRTDASASATEKLRAELTEGIARLLDGLVAREKALRLADRMLQSSLK